MARSILAVVMSDRDGCRDTVRDGIDGLRIPTRMPLAGPGGDPAARHLNRCRPAPGLSPPVCHRRRCQVSGCAGVAIARGGRERRGTRARAR